MGMFGKTRINYYLLNNLFILKTKHREPNNNLDYTFMIQLQIIKHKIFSGAVKMYSVIFA